MNFTEKNKDNLYLQIAWNAATVGLNPTRIKKGLLKRNTLLLYDIPRLCKLLEDIDNNNNNYHQEPMLLKTKARLLYGVSKIMRQKTFFLYEDALQLYNKLQNQMALPERTDHIDLERPFTNKHTITLVDKDDLLEYQTDNYGGPFTNLFDFSNSERRSVEEIEGEICSVLKMTDSLSIDLPYHETQYPEMLIPPFNDPSSINLPGDGATTTGGDNEPIGPQNQEVHVDLFDFDMPDYGDDMDYGLGDDNDIAFVDGGDNIANNTGLANNAAPPLTTTDNNINNLTRTSSGLMDDSVFTFPNTLHAADMASSRLSVHSSNSSHGTAYTSSGSHPSHHSALSGGHIRNPSGGPPPLIREEDENDNESSFSSIATDLLSDIVPDDDSIVISPIPPTPPRPRIIRRMMMRSEEETMIPWESYTTENIVTHHHRQQQQKKVVVDKKKILQKELRYPSILFNPYQKNQDLFGDELASCIISDNRNRLFFPNNNQQETSIEYTRNYIERSRRAAAAAEYRLFKTNNSSSGGSGGGVHLRSSSDLTVTPEMHNLDLADLVVDMQDATNHHAAGGGSFSEASGGGNVFQKDNNNMDYGDDNIDYNYLDFDNDFGDLLNENTLQQQQQQDEERGIGEFLEELHLFEQPNSNKVELNDLFQLKDRFEISKSFYYLLELSSRKKIRPIQQVPYGPIQIEMMIQQ